MKHKLAQLRRLSDMVFDAQQLRLSAAARSRQESLDLLASLATPPAQDLDPLTAARADLRYQLWADQRRAEINLNLARQTAAWHEAQVETRHAFGRTEALRLLAAKKSGPKP